MTEFFCESPWTFYCTEGAAWATKNPASDPSASKSSLFRIWGWKQIEEHHGIYTRLFREKTGEPARETSYGVLWLFCGTPLLAGWTAIEINAQAVRAEAHVAAARAAASEPGLYDLTPTFELLCTEREPTVQEPTPAARPANRANPRVPDRSEWYVEPVQVFDNLFNVGTVFHVWAVTTSDGIILLNSGRDYAAEAVVEGLEQMGLDPANVKYVIIHTPDVRHYGAAKLFQDRYNSRIMLSEADWNVIEATPEVPERLKPRRDLVVADGQTLTLGGTTLTLYVTPGNSPGTLSTLVPLREGTRRHVGLLIGGRDWDSVEQGVVYFSSDEEALRTVESPRGISPRGSHRTVREPLNSHGSCLP